MSLKTYFLLSVSFSLTASITLWQNSVKAADHLNLEEGIPLEVEDAYPVPYQGRELQGVFRYDRQNGEDIFIIESRIEYGFSPNWQGRISVPFEFGSGVEDGLGNVGLELFYNFNTESLSTPAFAISVGADFPTGEYSAGVDPTVKFIATKTIGSSNLDRLHLNLAYTYNDQSKDDERDHSFAATLGYSRRLNSETIMVTDLVYEQEEEENEDSLLLELGVRYQLNPRNVLAIGAGVGLIEDTPDFRITAGFQQSF